MVARRPAPPAPIGPPRAASTAAALFRAAAGALACGALAACGAGSRPGEPPRHLLLVTVDTLRADHLGAYGYPLATSSGGPDADGGARHVDRIAREGVLFANAFAPRGMTLPSIATILTGRSPIEHCAIDNKGMLPREMETLAEVLAREGFRSAAFTTNRLLVPQLGLGQGFDEFEVDWSDERDAVVASLALDWLARQDLEDGPRIFLWMHLMGPHLPYEPPPYGGRDFLAELLDPGYAGEADGSREFLDPAYGGEGSLSPEDVRHVVGHYDGEIARVDAILADFFDACAGEGGALPASFLRDAILVFAADHGEDLHQRHGYWGHAKSVYGSVLHVPLVLRHPRSLTGSRVFGELVELQDVMPTVLDWLEVEPPEGVRGRSLLPLVDGTGEFEPRAAFGLWRDSIFTVRTERWRLVWNPERIEPPDPPEGPYPIPEVALYDQRADPRELVNVADAHPEVVDELLLRIVDWRATRAECPRRSSETSAYLRDALERLGYLEGAAGADRE